MGFELDGIRYYSVAEVAQAVGVTRRTLYRWIEQSKVNGPGYERQRDKRRFFSLAELNEVAEFANRLEPVDESPEQLKLFNRTNAGGMQ